jgi:hypothetical protein
MSNRNAGPSAGTAPLRASSTGTTSPAARKFAEYLARRMVPMIEHAARANDQEDASIETKMHAIRPTNH